jgi:hypothetical protein
MFGQHATDIVGYTFNADTYCAEHIIDALPTGEGEAFDGWALAKGVTMSTEDNLSEIAYAFQIDRMDESSYDSSEFPKVIFADSARNAEGHPDHCAVCHRPLVED